ncbi:penicillin-binding protein activator LpoB [Sulfuriferula thiophila]|uniref:penicillin-binding protein activator LpoB n=1 Tax=Sulfuriferula thiophila TaxID=1781211 RepID=UPI000F60644F|nr:penicillin-binding protein activator LpoB [Sulfuriferula thiophila]
MKKIIIACMTLLFLAGCAITDRTSAPTLDKNVKWALLPMENHTETPQASLRMEAITETLLRVKGAMNLEKYPSSMTQDSLFEPADAKAVEAAINWAVQSGARYAVTGTVNEWRYKTGVDGEPAVGVTIKIIDLQTRQVVWDAAGARTGWGREAVSAIAQKLLEDLTGSIKLR